jgi:hypothetical protein
MGLFLDVAVPLDPFLHSDSMQQFGMVTSQKSASAAHSTYCAAGVALEELHFPADLPA